MKGSFVDDVRAMVANDQATKVAEPCEGAFRLPATPIATQGPTVVGTRLVAIPALRCDQLDSSRRQPLAQRIAVVGASGDCPQRFLAWPSTAIPPGHADPREPIFREPDFVGGRRAKLLSQRNTLAVDHHHPLRPLALLDFFPTPPPLFSRERNSRPETI